MPLFENKIIILGCGPSRGVPTASNNWGVCDPQNSKNNRTRASIYIEYQGFKILIDTSPDLRHQMLNNNLKEINTVLYTHFHADHCHGIDELRSLFLDQSPYKPIPIYGSLECIKDIKNNFQYLFTSISQYPIPILIPHELQTHNLIGPVKIDAFPQIHTPNLTSWGFRWNNIAYSTDFYDLPEESFEYLQGLDLWIIDCLCRESRPYLTHLSLEKTLFWIDKMKPKRAILTHMDNTLDYETLKRELPSFIEPAYDGMNIEF